MGAVAEQVARLRDLAACELSPTPPIPKSVKIELHSHCRWRCSFCAVGRRPRPRMSMNVAPFRRLAKELQQAGVERLGLFYMNEPFPDERLPAAIRIAKEDCGIGYVFLTSNALEASSEALRDCFEAGLDSLKFAINFAGQGQMPSSVADPAHAAAAVIETVRTARRLRDDAHRRTGRYCRLSASSLAYDAKQRSRMQTVLAEIAAAVDEHYWLPLLGRPGWAPTGTAPECSAADGLLRKTLPCWSLFSEAHIRVDGVLSACCLDASERFAMGDVTELGFEAAWHSERFRALRQAHLSGEVGDTVCGSCIGGN